MSEAIDEQLLEVTPSAQRKVSALIEEEGNTALMLRIYIVGGGCSGFQYGFAFDETINDDDSVIETEADDEQGSSGQGQPIKIVVDAMSLNYLIGSKVDYVENLQGAQFLVTNPNAKSTCGCGSSFSI